MFVLKATQQVPLSVGDVTDKRGNPTTLQNPRWSSSDPGILAVGDNGDGTGLAAATGPVGVATVVIDADADLGDGVVPIQGTAEVEVVAGDAAVVNITLGTPSEQADPPVPPPDGGTTPPDGGTPDGGTVPPPAPPVGGGI